MAENSIKSFNVSQIFNNSKNDIINNLVQSFKSNKYHERELPTDSPPKNSSMRKTLEGPTSY